MSFIENLTAESLNMSVTDFNAYMSGERVPANTWESALMICEVGNSIVHLIPFAIFNFNLRPESSFDVRGDYSAGRAQSEANGCAQ